MHSNWRPRCSFETQIWKFMNNPQRVAYNLLNDRRPVVLSRSKLLARTTTVGSYNRKYICNSLTVNICSYGFRSFLLTTNWYRNYPNHNVINNLCNVIIRLTQLTYEMFYYHLQHSTFYYLRLKVIFNITIIYIILLINNLRTFWIVLKYCQQKTKAY